MSALSGRIPVQVSDYDRQLVSAAGLRDRGYVVPAHDAAPVVTERSAQLIRALEGDPDALAALQALTAEEA